MSLPTVLLSGDARLKQIASPVEDVFDGEFQGQSKTLKACLDAFRLQHGFGRGIAAPQIGISKRFIALNLGGASFCLVNPEIIWHSETQFTMWDDCMCFPDTLVKLQRYTSVSIRFMNEDGEWIEWRKLDRALSELLQHELDHLNGVLALDHAVQPNATVSRAQFELLRQQYQAEVDYLIEPTSLPPQSAIFKLS